MERDWPPHFADMTDDELRRWWDANDVACACIGVQRGHSICNCAEQVLEACERLGLEVPPYWQAVTKSQRGQLEPMTIIAPPSPNASSFKEHVEKQRRWKASLS